MKETVYVRSKKYLKRNLDDLWSLYYPILWIECITWCITLNGGQEWILNLRTDGLTIGNASLINNSFTVALVKYINRLDSRNWIKKNYLSTQWSFTKYFHFLYFFILLMQNVRNLKWTKKRVRHFEWLAIDTGTRYT